MYTVQRAISFYIALKYSYTVCCGECFEVYNIDCGNLHWLALICDVCQHCEMVYSEMVANARLKLQAPPTHHHLKSANVV